MTVSLETKLASLSPARRRKVNARAAELIHEFTMSELRKARALTQKDVAKRLNIKQANVSKLEQRSDMMLSTLRSYIEAMGGNLDFVVRFKGQKPVRLSGLSEFGKLKKRKPAAKGEAASAKAIAYRLVVTPQMRAKLRKLLASEFEKSEATKKTRRAVGPGATQYRRSRGAA